MTAPVRDAFGPYGYDPVELPWHPPASVSAADAQAARAIIPAYEAWLAPPTVEWISGRIATLMAHYFTPDMPHTLGAAVFGDWIEILGDLPQHAVAGACLKWLKIEPRKRPTPGDIRDLAYRAVETELKHIKRLRIVAERGEPGSNVLSGSFPSNR